MRSTTARLADGREIVYYDEEATPPRCPAPDLRVLAPVAVDSQVRRDPLTGEPVVIAAHRQQRTHQPPTQRCPLCPSRPGWPTEVPDPDYDVVVFGNRFPALAGGTGRSEVVCFTAEHDASFGSLPSSRARLVVDVLAERTAALRAQPEVVEVFAFENRGVETGVTLHHPHGQIYGYPFLTPRTAARLATAAGHRERTGRHPMTDVLAGAADRVLACSEHWTALVPPAARWPVHVLLVPRRQVPDLLALRVAERDDLAGLYRDLLARLDRLYDAPLPYVAGWHQAPRGPAPELSWLHLEVFSVRRAADRLKYLAGSESGVAVWINDLTPERIAQRLRAL